MIKTQSKLGGEFSFAKKVGDKDVMVFERPSKNLILDAFINAIHNRTIEARYMEQTSERNIGASFRVGTGSSTPLPSNTALDQNLLITTNTQRVLSEVVYDSATNEVVFRVRLRAEFASATAVANISEVAVFTTTNGVSQSSRPIVSRALVRDSQGNPTTLTLAVGEILVVFYTFECREPAVIEQNIMVNGIPTLWQSRRNYLANSSQWPWVWHMAYRFALYVDAFSYPVTIALSDFVIGNPSTNITGFSVFDRTTLRTDSGYTELTPLNTNAVHRIKDRINLNHSNHPAIYGYALTDTGTTNGKWVHRFDPPLSKTNQDVIDVEVFTQYVRA